MPDKITIPPLGYDVFHWPEFQALIKRLGVPVLPTVDITITVPLEGLVRIAHDYHGQDRHLPQPEPKLTAEEEKAKIKELSQQGKERWGQIVNRPGVGN